jgi:hypothetical protein
MKKILLVVAIMVAVLALLALPKGQAGPGKGKSIKWKAAFIDDGTANLTGVAGFVGGVDHVNINNGLGTCEGVPYSFLELQVFTPSLIFKNMGGFLDWGNPDPADSVPFPYGFPYTTGSWPYCVANFLNDNVHPTAEYPHIILRFSTCGCDSTTDLMKMEVGKIIRVHMSLLFFSHIWGCPPNSQTFLNLNMNAHGYYKGGTPDIYIYRSSLTEWIASVDTMFDNSDYQNITFDSTSANWPVTTSDNILGQYATCDPGPVRKGKTTWTTTYHYPWAKAPLKFQIKFWQY